MTDIAIQSRLWTREGFRQDDWRHVEEASALGGNGRFILPLEAYLALDAGVRDEFAERIGVLVAPGEALDRLLPRLGDLPLIALAFPAFSDGRSYTKASLLRGRHGFTGELRATGDVLIDQIPHMLRCGFESFEVSNETALARLEAGRLGGIPLEYQPTFAGGTAGDAYAWRRRAG